MAPAPRMPTLTRDLLCTAQVCSRVGAELRGGRQTGVGQVLEKDRHDGPLPPCERDPGREELGGVIPRVTADRLDLLVSARHQDGREAAPVADYHLVVRVIHGGAFV